MLVHHQKETGVKGISKEGQDDLLSRGFSRRQMMRAAMLVGGGAAALGLNPELARAADAPGRIRLSLNECWAGPMAPGIKATTGILAQCNRYTPENIHDRLVQTIAGIEGVPEDHISTWPGSNEALARSVLVYCSPQKGLVTADPSYETAVTAAKFLGAPIKGVPLTEDYRHDVKAMLAANPNAGLYYICSPNNPTGTLTPMADIEWLVANKPQGAIVVVDEAYIHWTPDYPNNTATHLVKAGKEVLIMRTFSKVFGMAGMRMGFAMGRPDLIAKLRAHDGGQMSYQIPVPAAACAIASLTARDLIDQRRKELVAVRGMTEDFLKKRGLKLIGPSHANMLMIDWKTKTAKDMQAAFRAEGVDIAGGRWAIWPTVSRVSIGSRQEMEGFMAACGKVLSA
jgi:histidinol-phosphate aminotransferase